MTGEADPAGALPDPRLRQAQSKRLVALIALHLIGDDRGQHSRVTDDDDVRLNKPLAVPPQSVARVPSM